MFSHFEYLGIAAAIFVAMLMLLLVLSEFVFFEPYFILYVPEERLVSFVTLVAVAVLSGVVIPMNLYRVRVLQNKARKVGGSFLGSIIGAAAGACSCGPVGFAVISTFGTVGGIATSFLTTYEIPLRLLSIGILGFVYYATVKSIVAECKIR